MRAVTSSATATPHSAAVTGAFWYSISISQRPSRFTSKASNGTWSVRGAFPGFSAV
jgi:hypothetical protein